MKRVLLTGAGGFVGSHVLRHLLTQTNWHITAMDSFRHRGNTDRIAVQSQGVRGAASRVHVILHDLRAPISPVMARVIGPVDYVLHLAAESSVDRSIAGPREFCENNVAVTLTVLEWARQAGPSKLIHISTDEVFGPADDGYRHDEEDPHRPSNPYAASKAACEDLCHAWWRTYALPLCVTNTMNIIGETQDPEKFVPMTLRRVLAGQTVPIHAAPGGLRVGSRFYLHARNQADALLFLLREVPFPAHGGGDMARYNVVGEKELTNLELARMVAAAAGRDLRYDLVDFHSSRPGHDLRYALDGSRLAAAGWKAPVDLEESLRRTVAWTLRRPEWLA